MKLPIGGFLCPGDTWRTLGGKLWLGAPYILGTLGVQPWLGAPYVFRTLGRLLAENPGWGLLMSREHLADTWWTTVVAVSLCPGDTWQTLGGQPWFRAPYFLGTLGGHLADNHCWGLHNVLGKFGGHLADNCFPSEHHTETKNNPSTSN